MDAPEPTPQRLLVVDDELVDRMLLARAVAPLGFTVDAAGSIPEAVGLLTLHVYQAIVLDLALGETEGISLLPTLHASASDPLLVFVSGMDDRVRIASARLAATLGLRVAGAVAKPVAPATLRALLCSSPERATQTARPTPICPTAPELAQALARHRIEPAFQPKVSLPAGRVIGAEALARWHRPEAEDLLPDVFIPLAEASGLIVPLTEQILQEALIACRHWRTRFPGCGVAVNISPLALANSALPDEIDGMLRDSGLPPSALTAEITESMIIADPVLAAEVVTRLRIKGIGLSIDDFGTGHASLLSLMRLPFTELKIDRSFVVDCDTDAEALKIVRASISLAHELGMSVVAEGIETEAVARRLASIGCDAGQGWYFAHAMTAAALEERLAQGATLPGR
ncbi:MAG TPA: EAL domain-containing response regulator [Acetobacteraceae bacterium]|nr:EAL domain-containing response regulator [Acetobacteraceae bacterium]